MKRSVMPEQKGFVLISVLAMLSILCCCVLYAIDQSHIAWQMNQHFLQSTKNDIALEKQFLEAKNHLQECVKHPCDGYAIKLLQEIDGAQYFEVTASITSGVTQSTQQVIYAFRNQAIDQVSWRELAQ